MLQYENKKTNNLLKIGDYILTKEIMKCDDPYNKKGFTWNGILQSNFMKIFGFKQFGGINCAIVKIHHCMGSNYYGSEKIVPISEFKNFIFFKVK